VLRNGFEALLQLSLGLKTGSEGVAPTAEDDLPVRHGARWIAGEDGMECFDGAGKLK